MDESNQSSIKDIGYALAKGGIGSIPIPGAALVSELLGLIISPPLEKRRQKWMTQIGEKLRELEESRSLKFEDLSSNDQFIDTVSQATSLALKTSDEEKIKAFRNAIINTAKFEAPDKILSQIFLNLVDQFTSWHIKILDLFDNPQKWFVKNNRQFPASSMGGLSMVILIAFPELSADNELLDLIWADLHKANLHNTPGIRTTMSPSGLIAERTTGLGKKFLHFIQDHD